MVDKWAPGSAQKEAEDLSETENKHEMEVLRNKVSEDENKSKE